MVKHKNLILNTVFFKTLFQNEGGEFVVPYDAELECKQHVIVYDGNTRSLKEDGMNFYDFFGQLSGTFYVKYTMGQIYCCIVFINLFIKQRPVCICPPPGVHEQPLLWTNPQKGEKRITCKTMENPCDHLNTLKPGNATLKNMQDSREIANYKTVQSQKCNIKTSNL